MYRQRRDISSVAATLPTGKIFLPQVKYAPDNLAVSEICVNTHIRAAYNHRNFSRVNLHIFSDFCKRGDFFFIEAFRFSVSVSPDLSRQPHKINVKGIWTRIQSHT